MTALCSCIANLYIALVLAGPASLQAPVALAPPVPGAGQPRAEAAQTGDSMAIERKRERIRERIRMIRAARLAEALALDEATTARLLPILDRYDALFEPLRQERRQLHKQLRRLLSQGGDDTALNQVIDRMVSQQRKMWELQQTRFQEIRQVLTPAQAASILTVLPRIDRQIHRQVRRALHKRHGQLQMPPDEDPNPDDEPDIQLDGKPRRKKLRRALDAVP